MKKLKKMILTKAVLGELTSVEMGKLKGGEMSDSVNTKFTRIESCCNGSGCTY